MELGRALMSLEIGLPRKLFVAPVDAARPHSSIRGLLGNVQSLFLVLRLRSDYGARHAVS